jgi:hypothetical protein
MTAVKRLVDEKRAEEGDDWWVLERPHIKAAELTEQCGVIVGQETKMEAIDFYNANVPRVDHPEDPSGIAGVRKVMEARFFAKDASVMSLADACQFAEAYASSRLAEVTAQLNLLGALAEKAPQVTYAGNAEQYVDSVIYNHIEDRLDKILPDSLNRGLEERIQLLIDRANREADIAVRLRNRCEEIKAGSSSDI